MDADVIEAHAQAMAAGADTLDGCATRLRGLAARLRDHDTVPPWLLHALNAHITACVVASDDLTRAAARLHDYAEDATTE